MKPYLLILLITIFTSCLIPKPASEIAVTSLKCNYLWNPVGIDNNPNFSWISTSASKGKMQTAYQVIIDSDEQAILKSTGKIWDSGKIISCQSSGIKYYLKYLEPGKKYYWKVRVWDEKDKNSDWSNPSNFVTGLFENKDWENAEWIGLEDIPDSLKLVPGVHGNGDNLGMVALKRTIIPAFRKEFTIKNGIKQALLYICGLGQYEVSINGMKIGDRFLSPGWSDYRKTCLYNSYDVTDAIGSGKNAIGVITGNGFYNINRERYRKLVIAYGAPKIIMKLSIEYLDGTRTVLTTDDSWKVSSSPITYSGIYGGEDYDARLEQSGWDKPLFDDSRWLPAKIVNKPGGLLKAERDNPVKVMETLKPKRVFQPVKGSYVYDFRQNASGIIKLYVTGTSGQEVKIIPGELLGDDSLVTQRATGGPFYFKYTLKGGNQEVWIPKFTYYGFRYAEVQGAVPEGQPNPQKLPVISDLQFLHTRNSSSSAGTFNCSNELFNSIYNLINWSVKSNLASVATDCPHREKLGWLEQTHLMGNSIRYLYDIHNLYNKIIDDMIDAQLENGLVPDIAPEFVPFSGGFRDSPEWGSAAIMLPWDMYSWYGDLDAVRKAYQMMKKYLNYLKGKAENNILSYGLGDWFDLGPNSPGEAQLTPKSLSATSIYYYDNKLMAQMAELTGNKEDALYYNQMSLSICKSFNDKFFNPVTKVYSTGSQTAYSMPLFFDMADESTKKEVVANLISSIKDNNKALTAGDVGYRYLLKTLEQEGYSQLIYEMNSRSDVPGYGYQLSKGATALTESWAALKYVSNNHMMLGHIMEWFYSGLAGIGQTVEVNGSGKIEISPEPVGNITHAEASYISIYGEIKSSWKTEGGKFILLVTIPVNCKAVIKIPQNDTEKIYEGETPIKLSKDIKNITVSEGNTRFEVGSGSYSFVSDFSSHNVK